jgi:hypothetical protein
MSAAFAIYATLTAVCTGATLWHVPFDSVASLLLAIAASSWNLVVVWNLFMLAIVVAAVRTAYVSLSLPLALSL